MTIDQNILEIFKKVCADKNVDANFENELEKLIENWDDGKDITQNISSLIENDK
jgi:uncharacterized protein YjaG (DUF416 family)